MALARPVGPLSGSIFEPMPWGCLFVCGLARSNDRLHLQVTLRAMARDSHLLWNPISPRHQQGVLPYALMAPLDRTCILLFSSSLAGFMLCSLPLNWSPPIILGKMILESLNFLPMLPVEGPSKDAYGSS